MSKIVFILGIGTLSLYAILSLFGSSKVDSKIAVLDESIKLHDEQLQTMKAERELLNKENEALLQKIDDLKNATNKNAVAIKDGVEEAKKLAANRPPVLEECKEIVGYMQKEIDAYVKNFSIAIKDRDDWKEIAGNFSLALENQVKVSAGLQVSLDLVQSDSLLKNEIIKDLKRQSALRKLTANVLVGSTIAITIAVVIFGFFR